MMLKSILATVLAGGVVVLSEDSNYVCDGTYKIDSVQKCENHEQYKYDISITKRKLNRTHDGFTFFCDLPEGLTENLGMIANIYTKCDGGYKLADTYNFDSFCAIINQYVKVEFEKIMELAGYYPPNCPLPQGLLEAVDYVLDNRNLPQKVKCGDFKNEVYILEGETKVACITAYTTVLPSEDDEDD